MSSMTLFEDRQVRRVFHNDEWWFVLNDIVLALTDSANPSDYLKKLRRRDPSLAGAFEGGGQFVPPLPLPFETPGGVQKLQCWNVPGILRLIQSIPSPRAEPFKLWLARVGYERLQELSTRQVAETTVATGLRMLPFDVNLWQAQNIWNDLFRRSDKDYWSPDWKLAFKKLGEALYISVDELIIDEGVSVF